MTKTRITISLLIFLCSSITAYSQSWPSALLWRISGNGLQQPSYLYGTMHLQDRRLFFFSDSLYKALETSQGFAMEIDPTEMMDTVLSRLTDDKSPLLKEIMNEREFKKVEKKLEKKLGLPAEQITKKKLAEVRRRSIYKRKKADDMKTAVDLYLYDLAQRMGKYVSGIEDVSDQMGLFDEMGSDVDIKEMIKDMDDEESMEKYKEKMIGVYVKEDIETINNMVGPAGESFLSLIKRNIKMARRMDSLAHIRNSFFAVGAAHLPGDSGVISLLRQKGYTVEPVKAANKISPEKYVVAKKITNWVPVIGADSAYTIEMPGKASDMNMFSDELKFKTYIDFAGGNKVFMSCAIFIAEGDSSAVVQRIEKSFAGEKFKKIEEKKILHRGMEGKEFISLRESVYYRMQFFSSYDKAYMIVHAAEKKEQLYSEEAEHFFESFRPNLGIIAKVKNWAAYTDSVKAFTVLLPGKVKVTKSAPGENDRHAETNSYTTFDISSTTFYMLVVTETEKGYYISDDSLVFNAQADNFNEKGFTVSDKRMFEMNGYPAMSFTTMGKNLGTDVVSKMLVVSRGNRSYVLGAITEKGKEDYPNVTKFFRSFSLLPYQSSAWSAQQPADRSFSTIAPSPIDIFVAKDDSTTEPLPATKDVIYVSFDAVSANNYFISATPVSKYYHTKNDSTFLAEEIVGYYNDTASYYAKYRPGNFDSLVSIKKVTNGKANGMEVLVKNAGKSYYKRTRILRNGDSTYALYVLAPYAVLYNDNSNRFFEGFRFANEDAPTTIFTNKINLLLNDLLSPDSATVAVAKTSLSDMKFSGDELASLQGAFLKDYPKDTTDYYSVEERLANKINEIDSMATIRFVKENYALLPAASDKKGMMLQMLTNQKNQEAIAVLKESLLKYPLPTSLQRRMVYDLNDSLLLAKQLFPEVSSLFMDTVFGPAFISVAVNLADSNLISKQLLADNKNAILATGKKQLKMLQKPGDNYLEWGEAVIEALGIIADNESVQLLNELVKVKNLETKKDALLALIKINKPVPAAEIKKLVMDKYYRLELYDQLKKLGKTSLFPKEFFTQQKFAEAYIASAASEEDMDSENMFFTLLGEKIASFKGIRSRFYIFKVVFKYDEEKYEYPAVCGPFAIDKKIADIKEYEDRPRIFYDEKVPAVTGVDKLFKQYLKETEEQEKEIAE